MNVTPPSKSNNGLHFFNPSNPWEIEKKLKKLTCQEITNGLIVQIGSKSEEASIYKLIIDEHEIAVKIPRRHSLNKGEYDIHYYLSKKYPDYFINIYGEKQCPVILHNQQYVTQFIFMELALGDLKQIIDEGVNERRLLGYINDVFDSIALMAREGIYHNDLHIGNVFVNGQHHAVIADFGKSVLSQYISSSIEDLKKFLRSLRQYLMENSLYLSALTSLINSFLQSSSPLMKKSREYQDSGETWSPIAYDVILDLKEDWKRLAPY